MAKLSKKKQKVWDRLSYNPLPLGPVVLSTPSNPVTGTIVYDVVNLKILVFDGKNWNLINSAK